MQKNTQLNSLSANELEKQKIIVEIEEIRRRSSKLGNIWKVTITAVVLACAISLWLRDFFLPLDQIRNEITEKKDELRRIELGLLEKNIDKQRDSLKTEIAFITKEKEKYMVKANGLTNAYNYLLSKNEITKEELKKVKIKYLQNFLGNNRSVQMTADEGVMSFQDSDDKNAPSVQMTDGENNKQIQDSIAKGKN